MFVTPPQEASLKRIFEGSHTEPDIVVLQGLYGSICQRQDYRLHIAKQVAEAALRRGK